MSFLTKEILIQIRQELEPHFAAETSFDPENYSGGSEGHCTLVSMFLCSYFGGDFVSTKEEKISHWFNRLSLQDGTIVDVDLTGDQFGHEAVRVTPAGQLYSDAKVRSPREINGQTIDRFSLFLDKIKPAEIIKSL